MVKASGKKIPKKKVSKKTAKRVTKTKARSGANSSKLKIPSSLNGVSELHQILVSGACEHNLQNVDVEIPKRKLVVITGVSGSGKSSLAFDTIFAEGQRRYIESLSSFARQFLGQMEKPRFESIRGLSPTIAIEQKSASKNPRSTVGTITEVYDYLRVLYARLGTQFCIKCGKKVGRGDAQSMVTQLMNLPESTKIILLAPLVDNRKGEYRDLLQGLVAEGYTRVRIDGVIRELSEVHALAKNKKHRIDVVIDRLVIKEGAPFKKRLTDSVEQALKKGAGRLVAHIPGRQDLKMSEERSCCGIAYPQLDPPLFSFNSPQGMCPNCNGLGIHLEVDEKKLIPDPELSLLEGAVKPWAASVSNKQKKETWALRRLKAMEKHWKIPIKTPWKKLTKRHKELVLKGPEGKRVPPLKLTWKGEKSQGEWESNFSGIINEINRLYRSTTSDSMKKIYGAYLSQKTCSECDGARLIPEVLAVRFRKNNINDLCAMSIKDLYAFFSDIALNPREAEIGAELLKEIQTRLSFLVNVGLNYLSLDRQGPTLSGGEAQRIRLASQIGSELTGVLYVLDEPSIGLHQRDNKKLLQTLCHLRDIGNSLLVVEHDEETIEEADWVIDMGPKAGKLGGQIIACGTPTQIKKDPNSLTGKYLSGRDKIAVPTQRRKFNKAEVIEILNAFENNLANVNCKIPIGLLTCITGVSGAGKSSLINQVLYPALASYLHDTDIPIGDYEEIHGLEFIDKVINIDQKPIGRTPRSNPATYTKVFDMIRDVFSMLPESRERGYKKGRFSFNVKGGRCEQCNGDGFVKVEMHFLADVFVACETCEGKRFNSATLEVKFKGHSIADVLELSVREALELFKSFNQIRNYLETLEKVGLGYIKLGQPATTLSGGVAQRVKLARELAKRDTGRTLYILDEPTTGLHFEDIKALMRVLNLLVDRGNTVIVIEHNLDVIKCADWIIDLGPEGGAAGGKIVATGTPEKIAAHKKSVTAPFLVEKLSI